MKRVTTKKATNAQAAFGSEPWTSTEDVPAVVREPFSRSSCSVTVGPICGCRSFKYGHLPREHQKKLRSDMDWRKWEQLENTTVFEY